MKRVIVTGASGFIGQHLVRYLAQCGYTVSALVRESSDVTPITEFLRHVHRCELNDIPALCRAFEGNDAVIHLAALMKTTRIANLLAVNQRGTSNVAAACANLNSPPILIHMSTLAAAGPSKNQMPRTESMESRPVSNYGKSKLAGELEIRRFQHQIPISIIRPGIVLGEGDQDGFEIFKGVAKGNLIIVPSLRDHIFSVVHVADLVQAIELVLLKGERLGEPSGRGIYFVSARENLTFAELGAAVGRVLDGRKVWPLRFPGFFIWIVGAGFELVARLRNQSYIMNLDKAREGIAGAWHCDAQKLFDLGFAPAPLTDRLRQTANWYREHGWL
jgi:nucleoside-diphosphate-sugar epimerase